MKHETSKKEDHSNVPGSPDVKKNYTKVPNQLLRECNLTIYERMIMVYIKSRNPCFTGQATIAKDLSISRATVARSIKSLYRDKIIGKQKRVGKSVYYFLTPSSKWTRKKKG